MTEQEIIERWKQNDRYFASPNITDEMREWAKENCKDMQEPIACGAWKPMQFFPFRDWKTYRLRPDFELPKEPEFEYLEIFAEDGWFKFKYNYAKYVALFALSTVGFVGYTKLNSDDSDIFKFFSPEMKYVKIRKDAK